MIMNLSSLIKSKKVRFRWQSIKVQIQGAQILSDDSYFSYFEKTKDAAQRGSWTFYEAIKFVCNPELPVDGLIYWRHYDKETA